ncbi:MAG: exonuclease domain-containing protein [Miltoncostaeaceae bacterium]
MSTAPVHAHAAAPPVEEVPLSRLSFCVVDLETTGGSPGSSRITEIGAVRVEGLRIRERFTTLVDPGHPIPPVVTGITGIDDAMVAGAPPIERALASFVRFAGDDVLVAHNAPFDLRFLNYERRRLAGVYFEQAWLDTLALARHLLPGADRRHDLGSLAEWAGTRVRPTHRADSDAAATAEVLVRLIGAAAEAGVRTLADIASRVGRPEAAYAREWALCEELPPRRGVYILSAADGRPLHVAAATNLRREVRRRLLGTGPAPGPREVARVEHEVHGSRLGALLRADEISRRLGVGGAGIRAPGRYLTLGPGSRGLRVGSRVPDGALVAAGPVAGERTLRAAAECLRLLYPLDGLDPGAERRESTELAALLTGDPRALGALGARVERASGRGSLDPASRSGRRGLDALAQVLARLAESRRARDRVGALVEPAAASGALEVFLVRGGAVACRIQVGAEEWRDAVGDGVRRLLAAPGPEGPLPVRLRVSAALIEERLAERAAHPAAVRVEPGSGPEAVVEAIGRGISAVAEDERAQRADAGNRRTLPG